MAIVPWRLYLRLIRAVKRLPSGSNAQRLRRMLVYARGEFILARKFKAKKA